MEDCFSHSEEDSCVLLLKVGELTASASGQPWQRRQLFLACMRFPCQIDGNLDPCLYLRYFWRGPEDLQHSQPPSSIAGYILAVPASLSSVVLGLLQAPTRDPKSKDIVLRLSKVGYTGK